MNGFDRSNFFEIIESRCWQAEDGRKASLYGAVPWTSEADRLNWHVATVGWTVQHKKTGTVGIGQTPWKTKAEAEMWVYGEAQSSVAVGVA
jgi:hypothetical protein